VGAFVLDVDQSQSHFFEKRTELTPAAAFQPAIAEARNAGASDQADPSVPLAVRLDRASENRVDVIVSSIGVVACMASP
jgi:hypothetical protein